MRTIVLAFSIVALLPETQTADRASQIRAGLVSGQRVEVTLISGQRIKGRIQHFALDHFVVTADKGAISINVAYDDVLKVRARHSFKQKIGGLAMALFVWFGYTISCYDPPC